MTLNTSLDTKIRIVQKYMNGKGYNISFIKRGILGNSNGSMGPFVITKSNTIRMKPS